MSGPGGDEARGGDDAEGAEGRVRRPPHDGGAAGEGPQGLGLAGGGLQTGQRAVPGRRQLRPPRPQGLRRGVPGVPGEGGSAAFGLRHGGAPVQHQRRDVRMLQELGHPNNGVLAAGRPAQDRGVHESPHKVGRAGDETTFEGSRESHAAGEREGARRLVRPGGAPLELAAGPLRHPEELRQRARGGEHRALPLPTHRRGHVARVWPAQRRSRGALFPAGLHHWP
mmetsp:Transcript_120080/g.340451  ORF Transcript_120080/g.340451 Transcript_120080/m.340451 type:complete len:225 (-) Transcript_120080:406-1080(-)